jgi:hypothetical protein
MKNVIIASAIALASATSTAAVMGTPMASGTAEFGGTVAKVCDVYGFQKGRVVIRDGSDTNEFRSDVADGKAATFYVRANSRNSVLTFGAPAITVNRDDGVDVWYPQYRVVQYSGKVSALKNNRETAINTATSTVTTTSVGTNFVELHINITDINQNSMIPAGTYEIDVPVTCTKSTTAVQ